MRLECLVEEQPGLRGKQKSPERRAWRLPDRALVFAWVFAILSWAALGYVLLTPWTAGVTARHLAAAINCDAARAVGLAPARYGEPGYWPWLDRDKDGVACEVWRRRYRSR